MQNVSLTFQCITHSFPILHGYSKEGDQFLFMTFTILYRGHLDLKCDLEKLLFFWSSDSEIASSSVKVKVAGCRRTWNFYCCRPLPDPVRTAARDLNIIDIYICSWIHEFICYHQITSWPRIGVPSRQIYSYPEKPWQAEGSIVSSVPNLILRTAILVNKTTSPIVVSDYWMFSAPTMESKAWF